ncbi:MAG TPA: SH3 domain-containing protein [Methyloceanibacter sp.]|nr:SH3 domain-containing protein [Methyloceanibacter sp.]
MQPLRAQTTSEPSTEDIAALAKHFVEPLRGESPTAPGQPAFPKPTLVPTAIGIRGPQALPSARPSPAESQDAATAQGKRGLTRNTWVSVLVVLALIPLAMLFIRLWQDMAIPRPADDGMLPAAGLSVSSALSKTGSAQPELRPSKLEVALSSPDRIEAKAGDIVAFPIAIDATEALPARSIVAVTALPEGAAFSEGRPYGVTGWSLRPDEMGDLQLRLPARSGATDMRLELVAGDGTVLAQSETRLSIAPSSAGAVPIAASESQPTEAGAAVETTGSVASAPPSPRRKPAATAAAAPAVKVNTVKVVAIPAPNPARPHDGGYGLGPASEAPQAEAEWMVTKAAVDIHAKAEQGSETVKVVDKGLKLRVTARDKNWVQVTDPKTSTTGWIYNRFLTPAEQVAQ